MKSKKVENPQFDVASLHAALDSERVSRRITWKDVSAASGVSASTLTRLSQGKRPDVDSLAALTAWHASRVFTEAAAPRIWAALAWAFLPVATGAVAGGRLDVCVAAILLPVLARVSKTALTRLGRPPVV